LGPSLRITNIFNPNFLSKNFPTFVLLCVQRRVLIIFRNGQIILWDIRESRSIFRTGGRMLQARYNETKKVSCACWVCPFGSKVVVGYNNGELFIWSIPTLNTGNNLTADYSSQNTPMFKFNLGYKSDKTSIRSVKWIYAEGRASRLYVMGGSDHAPSNLLQVFEYFAYIIARYLLTSEIPNYCSSVTSYNNFEILDGLLCI